MDQAVSILGEKGFAKFVEFQPSLKATSVKLPENYNHDPLVWVISNCLVESHKTLSAPQKFNKRVIECRLATALASKLLVGKDHLEFDWKSPRTFYELLSLASQYGLTSLLDLVMKEFEEKPYTSDELKTIFGCDVRNLAVAVSETSL
jgi:galactokinase